MSRKYTNSYCTDRDIVLDYYEDGMKQQEIIRNFNWYFLITKDDYLKNEEKISKLTRLIKKIELIGNYVKIFCDNKNTTYEIDDKQLLLQNFKELEIKPLEADLFSDKRYCVDNDIEISEYYKILYFDIETDDSKPSIVVGAERILSIAAIDETGKSYFITDQNEQKILQRFTVLIKKYDVIVGWNSEKFDLPYIKQRMLLYNMRIYPWRSIAHIDLMKRFIHIFRFDNQIKKFSLDHISKHFLGRGKVEHKGQRVIDLFNTNIDKLKEYNLNDVILLKDLDSKIGCINMMILQAKWCKTFLSQFYISELLDNYILRVAHSHGIYCPTRNFVANENKYAGGFVIEPTKGLYRDIFVFDFKSLYPTLIMTSNIGFDTLNENGQILNPGTGKKFLNFPKSVISLTIEGLITKRKEYKKLKLKMIEEGTNKGPEWERVVSDEIVVKELSNSVYGIMGKKDSRWYSVDVAESITKFGQWVIKYSRKFFEKNKYTVIYGDTDSIFVKDQSNKLKTSPGSVLDLFHKELANTLNSEYNMTENKIELEFDKQYDVFLLVDKKTYSGHVINIEGKKTDDIYTRGLDYIKKSSIPIASKAQKELLDTILNGEVVVASCLDLFEKYKSMVLDNKLSISDVTIQTKINRDLMSYKTNLPHVVIAKKMIEKNGLLESREIDYIVVNQKLKNIILPSEYSDEYDREYYWNKKIFPLLYRLSSIVLPEYDWNKLLIKNLQPINQLKLL